MNTTLRLVEPSDTALWRQLSGALIEARRMREDGLDEDTIQAALVPIVKAWIPPRTPRDWACVRCQGTGWESMVCQPIGKFGACGRAQCPDGHEYARTCECSKGLRLAAAEDRRHAKPTDDDGLAGAGQTRKRGGWNKPGSR